MQPWLVCFLARNFRQGPWSRLNNFRLDSPYAVFNTKGRGSIISGAFENSLYYRLYIALKCCLAASLEILTGEPSPSGSRLATNALISCDPGQCLVRLLTLLTVPRPLKQQHQGLHAAARMAKSPSTPQWRRIEQAPSVDFKNSQPRRLGYRAAAPVPSA
jgi:hypothetical protein